MPSSLRTKLRIAGTVLGCRGFFDALAGRLMWQKVSPNLPLPTPHSPLPISLRGAIHVHTCTYSDGAGTVDEVMAAAKVAGIDFVLLTDHNTMRPKADGWEDKYAGQTPFLVVGNEITVEGGAFLLALDLPGEFEFPVHQSPQKAIDAVLEAGGLPLVSLPFDMKHPWDAWETVGCEGLEVLNLSTVAREHINVLSLLWLLPIWKIFGELAAIRAICTRPDASLRRWDNLLVTGKKQIGLGALDAHALMKILGKKHPIPGYENSFRAVSTHIQITPPLLGAGGQEQGAGAQVHEAIRAGRCYFAYDCLGDARGMTFFAGETPMGGDAPVGCELIACAPDPRALVRIYCGGKVVAAGRGEVRFVANQPGAYRVEVYRVGASLGALHLSARPWIFTNPIYVSPVSRD